MTEPLPTTKTAERKHMERCGCTLPAVFAAEVAGQTDSAPAVAATATIGAKPQSSALPFATSPYSPIPGVQYPMQVPSIVQARSTSVPWRSAFPVNQIKYKRFIAPGTNLGSNGELRATVWKREFTPIVDFSGAGQITVTGKLVALGGNMTGSGSFSATGKFVMQGTDMSGNGNLTATATAL